LSDEGVGTGLKKPKPAGDNEQGEEKERVAPRHRGGIKEEGSACEKQKADEKSALVSEAAHDKGCGDGQQKVTEVESRLNETSLEAVDLERLHELPNKNVIEIVGDCPQKKQSRHQKEGDFTATWKQMG
jgi:hypothetical protein